MRIPNSSSARKETTHLEILARAFAAQRPELAPRIEKALRILAEGRLAPHPTEPAAMLCRGSSARVYTVRANSCDCPWGQHNGAGPCCHRIARRMSLAVQAVVDESAAKPLRLVAIRVKGKTPRPKRPIKESMERLEEVTRALEEKNRQGIGAIR